MGTDGNIVIGTSVDVGGINTGLRKIEKSFGRLGKLSAIASGLGVGLLAKLGKAAVDAASDLEEVQNVVDVAFTKTIGTVEDLGDSVAGMGYQIQETLDGTKVYVEDMTSKIEEFAETSVEKFGMSRFAAKQTAGSFMAMGKSMDLTMEEASDMAVTLTGLTGDFASFYNISQDYARIAMSAVYTGETETLKRYGIVLTEANLQEYATARGIETTVKKMSARDKAILRYQYILQATSDMQGDFARTSNSWANSVRVLKELWTEFLIVLGNGLKAVLAPLVGVLSAIVVRLTQFMQTLWQILSNIFGFDLNQENKKIASAAGGISDTAGAMDDLGKSVEKAGKKTKKQLANFDELNNLTTKDDSSSGGGAGLDLSGMGAGGIGGLTDPTKPGSPWADIDNLYDLGKWIGEKLCAMMESIDWDSVYEKARNFGKGLAQFLNGLISTDLFKDVGHTIAGALNTVIYAALAFALEFDWKQLGKKLSDGVNEFFYTFDFASLAQAINKWVQGIWDAIVTFFTNLDYGAIFKGIKDFFTNIDPKTLMILLGFVALKKKIGLSFMTTMFEGIAEGLGWISLKTLFTNFATQIGLDIGIALSNLGSNIVFAFQMISGTLGGIFGGLIVLAAGAGLAIKSFIDMLKNGFSASKVILEAVGLAIAALGLMLMGVPAVVAGVVAGIVFAVSLIVVGIKQNWDAIKAWWTSTVLPVLQTIGSVVLGILKAGLSVVTNFLAATGNVILSIITTLFNTGKSLISGFINLVVSTVRGFSTTVSSVLTALKTTIVSIVQAIVSGSTAPLQNIKNAWINVFNSIKTSVLNIMNSLGSGIRGVINSIIGGINSMINGVVGGINNVINAMNSIPKLNINIPTVGTISIPHLAKGAVIPPNKEFMAVLGDQKSGTNIEAPLDTIKQAFVDVVSTMSTPTTGDGGDIVVQIDGREVFRAVRKQSRLYTDSTGLAAF